MLDRAQGSLQVLAGFLADFLAEIPQQEMELDISGWWTLNMDGAS